MRPSIEKRIEAGTVLFRAGDRCEAVALIHDGEIELLADRDGETVRVGTRGRGSFVGDDELLGDGIWRRTARALRRTRIEMLARDVYLERFAAPEEHASPRPVESRRAHLLPASPESRANVPVEGVAVAAFPFIVGRTATDTSPSIAHHQALLLPDRRPYHLSRRQFVVVESAGGLALIDPGSRLGTYVDGGRLGSEPLALSQGAPVEIRAGGLQSPFRFLLRLA